MQADLLQKEKKANLNTAENPKKKKTILDTTEKPKSKKYKKNRKSKLIFVKIGP